MAKLAKISAPSGREKVRFAAQDSFHRAQMGQIFGRFAAKHGSHGALMRGAFGPPQGRFAAHISTYRGHNSIFYIRFFICIYNINIGPMPGRSLHFLHFIYKMNIYKMKNIK